MIKRVSVEAKRGNKVIDIFDIFFLLFCIYIFWIFGAIYICFCVNIFFVAFENQISFSQKGVI